MSETVTGQLERLGRNVLTLYLGIWFSLWVMGIGELARRANVNIQTVRFYERRNLLPQPVRKPSGYRVYSEADLRQLLFIRQAKALGFSLEDIREILAMRARGACPCGRVISLAQRHQENIRETIRNLAGFEKELSRAVRKWKSSGEPTLAANEFCRLIERTAKDGTRKVKQ